MHNGVSGDLCAPVRGMPMRSSARSRPFLYRSAARAALGLAGIFLLVMGLPGPAYAAVATDSYAAGDQGPHPKAIVQGTSYAIVESGRGLIGTGRVLGSRGTACGVGERAGVGECVADGCGHQFW